MKVFQYTMNIRNNKVLIASGIVIMYIITLSLEGDDRFPIVVLDKIWLKDGKYWSSRFPRKLNPTGKAENIAINKYRYAILLKN